MKQPNIRLRRERELRGWSQARVAELIDTLERNVSRWERGGTPYPHFREKLCVLFGKSAQELGFVENEGMEPPSSEEPALPPASLSDPLIPPLPNGGRDLVGRQDLLKMLLEQICSGKNVALSGLPGVGKTALVVALVHHLSVLDTFCDGILWVGLGPRPNLSEQLSRWSTLLGLPQAETTLEDSLGTRAVALRAAIGMRHMLLVIDDAWDIEAALPFKVGGPNCALLVTTRFPTIAVSLAGDNAHVLHELPTNDGLALLTQLAPKAVAHDRRASKMLVQAVGGLPLALTLMGKYLQTQAYSDQPRRVRAALERLRNASERLRLSEPQAPLERSPGLEIGTPISLLTIIAVSDQQLGEEARAALRMLSVFPPKPNSFAEEAALAVSQTSTEILDQLSDAGLLESSGAGRYTLHQTIADYAATHLTETLASERLVAYVVAYLEKHATDYESLERENRNILAGLKYAYDAGQHARFVQGVVAFAPFLLARGLYDQAKLHLQRAYHLTIWSGDTQTVMTTLLHLGYIAYKQEDHNQAEAHLREALALAREHADNQHIREALTYLSQVAQARGDIEQMEAYRQEAASLAS